MADDKAGRNWFEWVFIEHRQFVWIVGSFALLVLGLGWSIRMGQQQPLYYALAAAALFVVSDALTWRRSGRARGRYELSKLPPPPRPTA